MNHIIRGARVLFATLGCFFSQALRKGPRRYPLCTEHAEKKKKPAITDVCAGRVRSFWRKARWRRSRRWLSKASPDVEANLCFRICNYDELKTTLQHTPCPCRENYLTWSPPGKLASFPRRWRRSFSLSAKTPVTRVDDRRSSPFPSPTRFRFIGPTLQVRDSRRTGVVAYWGSLCHFPGDRRVYFAFRPPAFADCNPPSKPNTGRVVAGRPPGADGRADPVDP